MNVVQWTLRLKSNGINGSPCSPQCHQSTDTLWLGREQTSRVGACRRQTTSCTRSASVRTFVACPTQSVWSKRRTEMERTLPPLPCRTAERVCRKDVPVARTPPSFFYNAASAGRPNTLSISYVHPGEKGTLDKHCENATGSSTTGVGLLVITSGGIWRTCSCGLRRCSSDNVSNVPGASVAPVTACRARDTWPCFFSAYLGDLFFHLDQSYLGALVQVRPIVFV